jgi:hypothetical protein
LLEVDLGCPFRSTVNIVRSTITSHSGIEGAQALRSRGRASIQAMILEKGRMEAQGQLRDENYFGIKPPLRMPTIVFLCELTTQGHL